MRAVSNDIFDEKDATVETEREFIEKFDVSQEIFVRITIRIYDNIKIIKSLLDISTMEILSLIRVYEQQIIILSEKLF